MLKIFSAGPHIESDNEYVRAGAMMSCQSCGMPELVPNIYPDMDRTVAEFSRANPEWVFDGHVGYCHPDCRQMAVWEQEERQGLQNELTRTRPTMTFAKSFDTQVVFNEVKRKPGID